MTDEQSQKKQGGVRLRRLNLILGIVAAILAVALFFVTVDTLHSYRETDEATARNTLAQQSAAALESGSDYLTDRVRTFVVTGDPQAAADFFEEINVTRRRDHALDEMERIFSGAEPARLLAEAMRLSNELAEIELYAMRLAIEADGYDVKDYPEMLQSVVLREEDLALTPTEQAQRARTLLFDETYQSYKLQIRANITACEQTLVGETQRVQEKNVSHLGRILQLQAILIAVLLITVLAVIIGTHKLVLLPLRNVINAIPKKETLPEVGSHEMRYLVRAYNEAYEQTKEHQDQLAYEATHDHLTGLYNRAVFEEQRANVHKRRRAMLLFDVDYFKEINDTYGHDAGDRVLKKVADTLSKNFRSEDYVCRIGGDEFAVILLHTDRSLRGMIERKLNGILAALRDTSDGLPVVTLSIGCAFCDRENPTEDLYKDADAALYDVKERGRSGFAFFDDGNNGKENESC